MASSLFQQLNQITNPGYQNNNLDGIKDLINMVKGGNNPMAMLQMLSKNNPQIAQTLNMVTSNKMSPKQLFMQMSGQNGVNPNDILNMLK